MHDIEVLVEGMTCEHCVMSVTEELGELAEVEAVAVDLRPGDASRVAVTASAPLDESRLRAAVEEAGYTVAGSLA
jgi:copper chaperone